MLISGAPAAQLQLSGYLITEFPDGQSFSFVFAKVANCGTHQRSGQAPPELLILQKTLKAISASLAVSCELK